MELTIERVRELLEQATPGPWAWRGQPSRDDAISKDPYLRSEVSPRYIVLDCEREGMQGATLRFRIEKPSIMQKVSQLGTGWRQHPDAALIAAAPDLARLALSLHTRLQQEREGRERLERFVTQRAVSGQSVMNMFKAQEHTLAPAPEAQGDSQ